MGDSEVSLTMFTRRSKVDGALVASVLEKLRAHFDVDGWECLLFGGPGADRRASMEDVPRADIERELESEGLVVHAAGESGVQLYFERGETFSQVNLGFKDAAISSPDDVIVFSEWLAVEAKCDLLFAGRPHRRASYQSTRGGLADGLRDMYWLTVFGEAFVKLLGADRIGRIPGANVRSLGANDHLLSVRLSDEVDCDEECDRAREFIGVDYFVTEPDPARPVATGNPLRALWHFFSMARSPDPVPARLVPDFSNGHG